MTLGIGGLLRFFVLTHTVRMNTKKVMSDPEINR